MFIATVVQLVSDIGVLIVLWGISTWGLSHQWRICAQHWAVLECFLDHLRNVEYMVISWYGSDPDIQNEISLLSVLNPALFYEYHWSPRYGGVLSNIFPTEIKHCFTKTDSSKSRPILVKWSTNGWPPIPRLMSVMFLNPFRRWTR